MKYSRKYYIKTKDYNNILDLCESIKELGPYLIMKGHGKHLNSLIIFQKLFTEFNINFIYKLVFEGKEPYIIFKCEDLYSGSVLLPRSIYNDETTDIFNTLVENSIEVLEKTFNIELIGEEQHKLFKIKR